MTLASLASESPPMAIVLILLIVLFAVGAGVALVRGLMAFSQEWDRIKGGGEAHIKRGERQNRMMFQRVIFQALAILAVTAFGLLFSSR